MADNEASIGIRAYLIDQISSGMSQITDSFSGLKESVESAVVPAVSAMENLADAEKAVVAATQEVDESTQGVLEGFESLTPVISSTTSTAEGAADALGSLASSAASLSEPLIEIEDEVAATSKELEALYTSAMLAAKGVELETEAVDAGLDALVAYSEGLVLAAEKETTIAEEAEILADRIGLLGATGEQVQVATDAMDQLSQSFKDGTISEAEFIQGAMDIRGALNDAFSPSAVLIRQTTEEVQGLTEALAEDGASSEYIDRVTASFQSLYSQLQAGAISVADFRGSVDELNDASLNGAKDMQELNTSLGDTEPAANGSLFALMMVQQELQQVSTTVDKAAEDMISSAGDQEEAMTRLQNALGVTDTAFVGMKQYVVDTANTSTFSAEQIAQSFTLMAEKGYTAGEIIQSGMGQALINFAEATNTDVMPATNLLITTMKTFGATADQAKQYTDLLTFAFQHGIPDASQLQGAIEQVGSTAAALKIPFDQVASALDWLADNGMENASQAGTSLRYMLTGLTDPTTKAAAELANLGIIGIDPNNQKLKDLVTNVNAVSKTQYSLSGSVQNLSAIYAQAQKLGTVDSSKSFLEWATSVGATTDSLYDKSGKLKSLPDIIDQIIKSVKALPAGQQQDDALGNLFNIKSGTAAKIMANAKDIKAQLMKILDGADDSTGGKGAAASQADKIKQDFNTKLGELKTSWQSFMATLGTPIISGLKPLIDDANKLVGGLQKSHSSWLLFAAVALVVLAVLLPIAAAIIGVVVLFTMLGAAGAALVGPILIIIGTVVALAVAAGLIIAHWGPVSSFFSAMGKGIQVAWSATITWLQGAFAAMGSWISSAFAGTLAVAKNINTGVEAPFKAMGSFFGGVFNSVNNAMKPFNDAMGKTLGPSVKMAAGEVKTAFQSMSAAIMPLFKTLQGGMNAMGPPAKAFAQAVGTQIMAAIKALQPWLAPIGAIIKSLGGNFQQAGTGASWFGKLIGSTVMPILASLVNGLKILGAILGGTIIVIIALVVGAFNGVIKAVGSFIAMLVNLVGAIVVMGKGVLLVFSGLFNLIIGLLTLNGPLISQSFGRIWDGIKLIFTGAVSFLVAGVTGLIAMVMNLFGGFLTGILGFMGNLANSFHKGSGDAMLAFSGSITNGLATVMTTLAALPGQVISVLSGLPMQMMNFGSNMISMMAQGITGSISKIASAAGGVANVIKDILGFASPTRLGPMSVSHTFMPAMMSMFASGITANKHLVTNAVTDVATGIHAGITSPLVANIRNSNGSSSSASSAANHHTYNVALQVDGKTMSNVVMTNISGDLKMNQMSTSWR